MELLNIESSDHPLWDIWLSMYKLPTLTVADELNLFSIIQCNNMTISSLAKLLCVDTVAIESLIHVLVGLNFLFKKEDLLQLTDVSKTYLLPDSPFYWGAQLKGLYKNNEHQRIMSAIKESTKTLSFGTKTFTEMWENGAISSEAAQNFTDKMHATIYASALAAIKSGAFKSTKNLLDMGGGSGCFTISFIQNYPQSHATIFELPSVCEVTKKYVNKFKILSNLNIVAGNFFTDTWPENHDGILFSQILHDWPLSHCQYLAKKAYETLPSNGKIYIHEMLLDEDKTSPVTTACFNLLMYINHGSQQFTKSEILSLLSTSGFKKLTVNKTFGYYSLITGTK